MISMVQDLPKYPVFLPRRCLPCFHISSRGTINILNPLYSLLPVSLPDILSINKASNACVCNRSGPAIRLSQIHTAIASSRVICKFKIGYETASGHWNADKNCPSHCLVRLINRKVLANRAKRAAAFTRP